MKIWIFLMSKASHCINRYVSVYINIPVTQPVIALFFWQLVNFKWFATEWTSVFKDNTVIFIWHFCLEDVILWFAY